MFYIMGCPHCGQIQVKETKKIYNAVFKCVYCNKSRKIKQKITYGLSVKLYDQTMSGSLAAKICGRLKEKKNENT